MVWFAKLRQVPPGPQKDVLGGIAGVGFVAEDRHCRPEGRGKPGVDEIGERFAVAAPGALDEERFARSDRRCHQDAGHVRRESLAMPCAEDDSARIAMVG